ncbi:hypothetical protein B0682_05475 [Moraxella lincolnii]|uniref:Uncharacterized protein n=1 Tax=Lwoffella lincolnii TaxID=90241 RepID=A0A1T0CE88_9GAMM|nr:hypothetical protein B0682_05475 [Moraxella lincolnii]
MFCRHYDVPAIKSILCKTKACKKQMLKKSRLGKVSLFGKLPDWIAAAWIKAFKPVFMINVMFKPRLLDESNNKP